MTFALDPNLASLASNAAVELDLHINGEKTDFESVSELAKCIGNMLVKPTTGQSASAMHADTEIQMLLGQSFVELGSDPNSILSELASKTEELVNALGSDHNTDTRKIEWLRSYCLALSKNASSFRKMILDSMPQHPNRR